MRTFVALELPERFADDVAALAHRLEMQVDGRFPPRETHHLTLAFTGNVDERTLASLVDAVERACKGRAGVALRAEGLGTFGRRSDATLWLGIAPDQSLMELAAAIRDELSAHGVSFDGKAFKPHVTLARRTRISTGTLADLAFPLPDTARRVTVFKSTLTSDGAKYKPLHTVLLA